MSRHARPARRRLGLLPHLRSVAGQAFILQLLLILVLVAAAVAAVAADARAHGTVDARRRSLAVAETFAHAPGMARAMSGDKPTSALESHAEATRKGSGVDSVVVFDTRGIRLTHPERPLIGKRIVGPAGLVREELRGKTISQTFRASQGPSVVSAVPITGADGTFLGGVSVGVKIQSVHSTMDRRLPMLLGSGAGALVLATGGAALLNRRVRRQTHGLGTAQMTRMYEHHDAVLHSVREGVLVLTADKRLLLVNDEARELLRLAPDAEGRHVGALGLEPHLTELLTSGRHVTDEVHPCGERLLSVNLRSTDRAGAPAGSVVTLRDTTALRVLSDRAVETSDRLKLLSDAGVRISSTLELTGIAEKLVEVAVPRFADIAAVELLDPVLRGEEPEPPYEPLAPHRTAVGGTPAEAPLFRVGERVVHAPSTPQSRAVRTGAAVLLQADPTGTGEWPAGEARRLLDHGIHSLITVPLRFRGVTLGLATFWRARHRAPFDETDLAIVRELAVRTAVCVDNARRYAREHAMVTALQRTLLPGALPDQNAAEVAARYLPAPGGTGGSWFDVIPLPGARVALVVGKVAGQGLHTAATMGRLRTAVQNFSARDVPPDELLSHMDELVTRLALEHDADAHGTRIAGAGCLYAIHDSVSGHCTVARAGDPGLALAHPDGTVEIPAVPVSPPLGLGREPFEAVGLSLPAASRLVLYTNGLLEGHDRTTETGLDLLGRALAAEPDLDPDETCRSLFQSVLPPHPSDDVALLVARTRLLDPENVAEWDVPSDPAAVASLRTACARRLQAWGLEDAASTAKLIISELITNALRYGAPPVHLRLLRDRRLICEVSDGSNTAPHMRRAATTDEGGRGLFLVAQFAQRWGTRYTPHGKVIWAETPLDGH
ncbi:SpoIIE family protein phosphatase [Streptomyces rapamycinicus]|uniref:Histidine kinase n=2 Tax=Streptomyces rapamycinicus TaxID=1226757 RepID=A0A0A0NV58_STRRN|nr:SpoIIE family protein phosphatase [Streptomyces rapamycinicus]AGP60468.1 histidine kinase [Streptomyces rapamycinicus NRRL 5491]MBB4788368.1 serine phosphatase RsbU (regulator of sigma subunit)/PAS domain-containing protein/anti-sigma regulatory factor (Ser/Thr protein kinase) [Streptomyces rapamycinicus]RLV72703.1 histidine kinase [Streptomyces rapamycinicus NRRL 5491]UTP36031.1 SpoIIE family protein phosphatase [Streptomyces rapamycinicus NRRL 5491]